MKFLWITTKPSPSDAAAAVKSGIVVAAVAVFKFWPFTPVTSSLPTPVTSETYKWFWNSLRLAHLKNPNLLQISWTLSFVSSPGVDSGVILVSTHSVTKAW